MSHHSSTLGSTVGRLASGDGDAVIKNVNETIADHDADSHVLVTFVVSCEFLQ